MAAHIFDAAPRPIKAPTATVRELWFAVCSCGWRSSFVHMKPAECHDEFLHHLVRIEAAP